MLWSLRMITVSGSLLNRKRCDLPLLLRSYIVVGLEACLRIVVVGLTLEGKIVGPDEVFRDAGFRPGDHSLQNVYRVSEVILG